MSIFTRDLSEYRYYRYLAFLIFMPIVLGLAYIRSCTNRTHYTKVAREYFSKGCEKKLLLTRCDALLKKNHKSCFFLNYSGGGRMRRAGVDLGGYQECVYLGRRKYREKLRRIVRQEGY